MIWTWWVLAIVIPCWVMQNFLHEFSHLLSARFVEGLKPKGLWPLWHWMNKKTDEWRWWRPWELWKKPWPDARFYFARYRAEYPAKPRGKHHPTFIAPVYMACVMIALCVVGMVLVPRAHRIWFLPQACCAAVDLANWWRGYFGIVVNNPYSDGPRWRNGDR